MFWALILILLSGLELPFAVQVDTALAPDWLQVCQRISQSEDGLARWKAVAVDAGIAADAKAAIGKIAAGHGAGEE